MPRKTHKVPNTETRATPGVMEGVLAELERLRAEVEELRADRDHWMRLWQRAANATLRLSPPTKFNMPGPLPEPVTLTTGDVSDITAESMADFKSGMTLSWEELCTQIDALACGTEEDPIKEGIREYMRRKHTPFLADEADAEAVQAYNSRVEAQGTFAASGSERRLAILAEVMETPLDRLKRFIDMLGTQPLTEDRIVGAQYALGFPTPVCSHLAFPLMDLPPNREACKLLEEFGLRKQAIEVRRARAKRKGTP